MSEKQGHALSLAEIIQVEKHRSEFGDAAADKLRDELTAANKAEVAAGREQHEREQRLGGWLWILIIVGILAMTFTCDTTKSRRRTYEEDRPEGPYDYMKFR